MGTLKLTLRSLGSWVALSGFRSGVVGVIAFRFLTLVQQNGDGLSLLPVTNSKQGTTDLSTVPQDIAALAGCTQGRP
ncbi:hypothetical protein Q3G72_032392 [Acer saccharum]|nr:hypothetical protein Q3G72_032392 [Acer saccharum]